MAFHGRIFGWLPWQWTWAISCDGMRTHNYTRGRASYVPTRCVLCFEMQRAMHRSHGNKRGTIGSRSTSAVILTKYSARSQMFWNAAVRFRSDTFAVFNCEGRPSCKHAPTAGWSMHCSTRSFDRVTRSFFVFSPSANIAKSEKDWQRDKICSLDFSC